MNGFGSHCEASDRTVTRAMATTVVPSSPSWWHQKEPLTVPLALRLADRFQERARGVPWLLPSTRRQREEQRPVHRVDVGDCRGDCVGAGSLEIGSLRAFKSGRSPDDIGACAFHLAGSSGDLPDLHGFHNPSTVSLLLDTVVGWRSARVDSLDLRLSVSVAQQAQTIVSAIGGLRLAAPCSVAAASARRCGKGGVRDQLFVTQMTHILTQRAYTGPAWWSTGRWCMSEKSGDTLRLSPMMVQRRRKREIGQGRLGTSFPQIFCDGLSRQIGRRT